MPTFLLCYSKHLCNKFAVHFSPVLAYSAAVIQKLVEIFLSTLERAAHSNWILPQPSWSAVIQTRPYKIYFKNILQISQFIFYNRGANYT